MHPDDRDLERLRERDDRQREEHEAALDHEVRMAPAPAVRPLAVPLLTLPGHE